MNLHNRFKLQITQKVVLNLFLFNNLGMVSKHETRIFKYLCINIIMNSNKQYLLGVGIFKYLKIRFKPILEVTILDLIYE